MLTLLLSLFAGAILALAFSPFDIYTFAFFAPAILLYRFMKSTAKQAALHGFLFGLGLFSVGSFWVYISIHNFGGASLPLSILITLIFISALSLFPALLGYVFDKLFKDKSDLIRCLLAFPALWVFFEWLRSWVLNGFPWFFLGYAQLHAPLKGLIPVFGVYGLSLFTAMMSGGLVILARNNTTKLKLVAVSIMIAFIGSGVILSKVDWSKPFGKPIEASLVQGNISQHMKWDIDQLTHTLNIYKKITDDYWDSKLIIWPEAAVPAVANQLHDYFENIKSEAIAHDSSVIIGAPLQHDSATNFYNGLIMLGVNDGVYLKRHLVPFGEYTPLSFIFKSLLKRLNIPMSNFSAGPPQQAPLQFNHIKIAPFICYETAFPVLALQSAQQSNMLVTILDDAWFGNSIALPQQLQMSQMRAFEAGQPMLVASNTGITAIINPDGTIQSIAPVNKRFVLTASVQPTISHTPLIKWNYFPTLGLVILFIVLSAVL